MNNPIEIVPAKFKGVIVKLEGNGLSDEGAYPILKLFYLPEPPKELADIINTVGLIKYAEGYSDRDSELKHGEIK